ncbi:MAG: hypothetical protein Q4C86_12300 [bacterium]|nr:hypothetical protein [bacterium]
MRTVKILLRVITLVVVLTVSSAAALASPAVSDNYQKIPLSGLNVGGTLVDDDVWAFPGPPDTELQDMIKEDAGNGLYQLLGSSEILTAWQTLCSAAGSGNSIVLASQEDIPAAITNGAGAYITELLVTTEISYAYIDGVLTQVESTKSTYTLMEAVEGITVDNANRTVTVNTTDTLSFEKNSPYAIFIVKGNSGPAPEPVRPIIIISKDYEEYPVASIDVSVDEPLPAGITPANVKRREKGLDGWRGTINKYIGTDDTLDSIDWPEGFKKDDLVSLSVLTAVGVTIDYDKETASDGNVTFHIRIGGFNGTFTGSPCVFIVAPGTKPYRLTAFPARYDAETATVTFTVIGYKKYFSFAIPIIGDVKLKSQPIPEPPDSGGSSGGCSAAPWGAFIALVAAWLCPKARKK